MAKGEEKVEARADVLCSYLRHVIEVLKNLLENIEKEDSIDDKSVDKVVEEAETDLKRLRHSVLL